MPKFLRLNNDNPTALRPLRVEDLQDIWDAVTGMLSQSVNTPVIVSGFNYDIAQLDPTAALTSGVIAYRGKLYEYNAAETPLRLGAFAYLHDNVSTDDDRTLSDGTVQTFSYKSIVNGDPSNSVRTVTLSVQSIDLMKSAYIAPRAVRGENIALQTVARENLVRSFAPVVGSYAPVGIPRDALLDDFIVFEDGKWEVSQIGGFVDGTTLTLDSNNYDLDYFPDTFSVYVFASSSSLTLNVRADAGLVSYVTQIVTMSPNKAKIITFGRVHSGYAVISAIDIE